MNRRDSHQFLSLEIVCYESGGNFELNKLKIYKLLTSIVHPNRVSDQEFESYAYGRDLSPAETKLASFIVRPQSTSEVSAIMKMSNECKVPVYVRGCGCSHWSGWLPVKGGILLDMTSMDKLIEIDKENLSATVESGCTWYKLDKELRKRGLTHLSSEMGGPAMTVGGSVIKAGGGPYGTCKFGLHGQMDILGFEVVLPTGEIVKTGSWASSGVPPFRRYGLGPDLIGLMIGSEGTLGILTKVTLRVRPVPEYEEYLFFNFNQWQDIVKVGDAITRSFGDELAYSLDTGESAQEPGKINARIQVFGYEKGIIEYRRSRIREICIKNDGIEGDSRNSADFFNRVVTGLKDIFAGGVWHFSGCGAIPIHALLKYVNTWREIVIQKHNFLRSAFGAWAFPRGWVIYIHFLYSETTEREKVLTISNEINKEFLEMGIIPYGIGGPEGWLPYIRDRWGPYYELIKKIKKALDPNNVLQPGILID